MQQTIAAIATPPGTGGIAVIRISGEQAFEIAGAVFHPKNSKKTLKNARGYTALFGRLQNNGAAIDEGVALCFRAPHSYTGENVVELSCHGGETVSREVLRACIEAGAVPAQPGEFTKRALLNGKISLTQAEAVMDLISAHSKQGAAAARMVMQGGLFAIVRRQKEQLTHLAGHLAAYIDYPEEDVEELRREEFLGTVAQVGAELGKMIRQYDSGLMLKRGARAVIAGSPNVGKSTLFNVLSGFERAIVTPVAGTTRDVVREEIIIAGVPLHLADTAGLHETDDLIEEEGIRRSNEEMEQASLILAVFDGSLPFEEAEWRLAQRCEGRPSLALINKSDLGTIISEEQRRRMMTFFDEVIIISAKNEGARAAIEGAVARILKVNEISNDSVLLANERQLAAAKRAMEALKQAQAALEQGFTLDAAGVCLDDALIALSDLTGESASEAVIDDVFSRFCVGK